MEMLLVVNVELPGGGEVNGWLDEDTVDSGYGPIALGLDAVAEPTVVDPAPPLLLGAELDPTDDGAELAVGDPNPLLLPDAELDPADNVAELTVGDPTPLLLPDAEPDPMDDVAELIDGDAALVVPETELDPATSELLEGWEAVMIAEEEDADEDVVVVVVVVVTTFPA
jgi:hypothetical protein